ncbi:hypothetical protein KAU45_00970 [bacterium]|nr:hypothetical protein [bacterium]
MKLTVFLLIAALSLLCYADNMSKHVISLTMPQLGITGFSSIGFYNNELFDMAATFVSGFTYSLTFNNNILSLSGTLPFLSPNNIFHTDEEDIKYDAWFWGLSPTYSYALLRNETFNLLLDVNYSFNYFVKEQYVEPEGEYEEKFHYFGCGLSAALLGTDPDLEEPDYYSWVFSQQIGYSWEGQLTGLSSIMYHSTGMFELLDDSPFWTAGVELSYSSAYIYLKYFWEIGLIL